MTVLIRIQDAFTPLTLWVILKVSACFYMDMNCFGPVRVVSSLLRVGSEAADIFGWVVADGFRWLRMISGGFGWFRMVSGGFGWFVVLAVTSLFYCESGINQCAVKKILTNVFGASLLLLQLGCLRYVLLLYHLRMLHVFMRISKSFV